MNRRAMARRIAALLIASFSVAACDTWMGENKAPPLPGKRISILAREKAVEPEMGGPVAKVVLPPPEDSPEWPQAGGYSNHAMHHMAISDAPKWSWINSAGFGSSKRRKLLGSPIVADGKVFTVDSLSRVSAFDVLDGKRVWGKDVSPEDSNTAYTSGGIAYDEGQIFVATGYAQVVALDAKTGGVTWRQTVSGPMRGAPTVRGGRVFAVTVDNQTHALSAEDGSPLWTHSGISEVTGLLAGNSPAVDGNTVVVAYTSGELFALKIETGAVIWQDSLITARRTENLGSLMDIRGRPVIDRGRVYAIGNGDLMVCVDLKNGRRLWEKEIGGVESPWIAGDYIFLVTNNNEALALESKTGRIVWVTQLQTWEKPSERTDRVRWAGPVLASDRLIFGNTTGKLVALSPYTGDLLGWEAAPDGVSVAPVIAGGTMYFLTDDGDIVAYR